MKHTLATDRYFFMGAALFFLLVNLIGFSTSTQKKLSLGQEIPTFVVIHGITFSTWILMYALQAMLISFKNHKLHMRLGILGTFILAAVFLSGFYTVFMMVPFKGADGFAVGRDLYGICLALVFGVLGLVHRHQAFQHKRYLFYATLMLSSAGIARIPILFGQSINVPLTLALIFVPGLILIVYDYKVYKKLFRFDVYCFFGLLSLLVGSGPLLWKNPFWEGIVRCVVSIIS